MVEQLTTQEHVRCIYKKNRICYLRQGVPLASHCSHCDQRITDLTKYTIHNKFTSEKYRIHQIYDLIKKNYVTTEDVFPNPEFHCLRTVKYRDPEKKDKIKFNIFNLTENEYYFEVFELENNDKKEIIVEPHEKPIEST